MQVSAINTNNLINNINTAQTKSKGDFENILRQKVEATEKGKDDAKLKSACQELEAVFLNLMLSRMRNTVPKSDLVDTSKEEIMRSMLDSEMTKNMASAGGIGLADMLYRQLKTEANTINKSQAPR